MIDYYIMALKELLQKVDYKLEKIFLSNVSYLKDLYAGTEIHDYVFYNQINDTKMYHLFDNKFKVKLI